MIRMYMVVIALLLSDRASANCGSITEVPVDDLTTASMSKELRLDPYVFRERYEHLIEFFKAGGKGRVLKYVELQSYGLAGWSGPYVIVTQLPPGPVQNNPVLWIRDPATFSLVREMFKKTLVILDRSFSSRASVANLRYRLSIGSAGDFVNCGYLPSNLANAVSLGPEVTESVLVHEMVHLDDNLGALDAFAQTIFMLRAKYPESADDILAVRRYVMEQRAYAHGLAFMKDRTGQHISVPVYSNRTALGQQTGNQVYISAENEFATESELAKKAFKESYIPDFEKALANFKDRPELRDQVLRLVSEFRNKSQLGDWLLER